MQAFRLQNFRGFRDTGWIELKPLTLLVGANSTGKSSLLRFLPLLRQSMGHDSGVPFTWAREGGVDFGTAQDVVRRGTDEPMRVGVRIATAGLLAGSSERKRGRPLAGSVTDYTLSITGETPVGEVKQFSLRFGDHQADVTITGAAARPIEGTLQTDHPWLGPIAFRGGVVPDALLVNEDALSQTRELLFSAVTADHNGLPEDTAETLRSMWAYQSTLVRTLQLPLSELRSVLDDVVVIKGHKVTASDEALAQTQAKLWPLLLNASLGELRSSMQFWSEGVEYIGPARFPPARYHRLWADRPRRLMPDGANLAVLFSGLRQGDRDEFNTFLQGHLGYTLSLRAGTGNAELVLTNAEGDSFNLADLGFGFSQVVPVLLQAYLAQENWEMARKPASLFVVEQPELHLHPKLQAQLADLFVMMSARPKSGHRPVPCFVETHSKALLERVGELIDEKAISREDVQVLLFEKDGKDCNVRATGFDDEGVLLDWPVGFLSR
jgi:predicted ATPase